MKSYHFLPAVAAGLLLAPLGTVAQTKTQPAAKPQGAASLEIKDPKPAATGAGALDNVTLDPSKKEEPPPLPPISDKVSPDSGQLPPALLKLAEDQRLKYAALKDEATNFMRTVRLQEAMEKLIEAEKIVGEPLADIENLRGALYTKMRDYTNARTHFRNSLKLMPDSFHPRFNLAELDFVEKKWEEAQKAFLDLVKINEKNKAAAIAKVTNEEQKEELTISFDGTTRLMQFKVYICQLQQKKDAEAKEMMKNFKQNDFNSPVFYFSNAAACYIKDDKDTADGWIASAKSIYPAHLNEIFIDSLVEMGWLQGLN